MADCVIRLDQRVTDQISTRRLRIVKYRGSAHGTNEYPFLITSDGVSVLPVTSMGLEHQASTRRIATGVPRLDTLLGGKGYYRGSSVLVSGGAGTGKTTLAAAFAAATCRRGERCLYIAFEESASQILRNMRSVGIDLEPFVKEGIAAVSPGPAHTRRGWNPTWLPSTTWSMRFQPAAVVTDPVTNLTTVGSVQRRQGHADPSDRFSEDAADHHAVHQPDIRRRRRGAVGGGDLFADGYLAAGPQPGEQRERNRGLYILKSRGMAHSNQVREFVLSDKGIQLIDVYTGGGSVLTGSARVAQLERERLQEMLDRQQAEAKRAEIRHRRAAVNAQIESLKADLVSADQELKHLETASAIRRQEASRARAEMAQSRMADAGRAQRRK